MGRASRGLIFTLKLALPFVGIGMLVLLYANYTLEHLYGFYINDFVINLLTTPGGTEALGSTPSFYVTAASTIAAIVIAYLVAAKGPTFGLAVNSFNLKPLPPIIIFVSILIAQAAIYAVAEYKSYVPVLAVSDRIAWYQPITAKSFLEQWGLSLSPGGGIC